MGKKIEAYEMKMASLAILVPLLLPLMGTAVAVLFPAGTSSVANPGPHGFSEILYAFSSGVANNGSAFAGLNANTLFYNTAIAVMMFFGRYWILIPVLAISGSLVMKKSVPFSSGHPRNPYASVHCLAGRGGRCRVGSEFFAGAGAGTDRGALAA